MARRRVFTGFCVVRAQSTAGYLARLAEFTKPFVDNMKVWVDDINLAEYSMFAYGLLSEVHVLYKPCMNVQTKVLTQLASAGIAANTRGVATMLKTDGIKISGGKSKRQVSPAVEEARKKRKAADGVGAVCSLLQRIFDKKWFYWDM